MRPERDRIEVPGATISLLRWGRAGDHEVVAPDLFVATLAAATGAESVRRLVLVIRR